MGVSGGLHGLRNSSHPDGNISVAETVTEYIHLNGIRVAGFKGKRHLLYHGRFDFAVFRSQLCWDEGGEQK
jgi:hypothetical protein